MSRLAQLITSSLILVVIGAAATFAQTGTSSITGTVLDVNGAAVPGATVTALNEATGVVYTQTSNDSGLYSFSSLPVGVYTVTVEKQGFKKFQKTKNALEVGTPLTVDVAMEVGLVSEVVTVQGGTEQLQTANATLGNVVEQKAIETLPLNGRNPLTLLLLEPGVVQRSFGGAGSGVHVNGARDRAYNVTIDGIEANESSVPNPVSNLYRINPDNVQEFKVTTNNATAEEGRNSGASISIASRAGTSDFHGTGFFFLRNDALNSNEWFANKVGKDRVKNKFLYPGFNVSGPVLVPGTDFNKNRDKVFFFLGYEYFKQALDTGFPTHLLYLNLGQTLR